MIGDDPTGKDSEPMIPEPISPSALSRGAAPFPDVETRAPAPLPWSRAPVGRRISFTAWGVAGAVGIALWVVIIKLV